MAENLKDYLAAHTCKGFNPVPHYFASGDYATCFFSEERCHEKRVDDLVTVYLSNETKKLVGCKINGVKHILDSACGFGVSVDDGSVKLGLFFWMGASLATEEDQKQHYEELRELARDAALDRRQLQSCGS